MYPTGVDLMPFSSTPKREPLRMYLKDPSSTRNLMRVAMSLYSCISSKKMKVSPFIRGFSEKIESLVSISEIPIPSSSLNILGISGRSMKLNSI